MDKDTRTELLLIIFRADHSTSHPVVAAGLSLTLLAFCTDIHTQRKKGNRILSEGDVNMLCQHVRSPHLLVKGLS